MSGQLYYQTVLDFLDINDFTKEEKIDFIKKVIEVEKTIADERGKNKKATEKDNKKNKKRKG